VEADGTLSETYLAALLNLPASLSPKSKLPEPVAKAMEATNIAYFTAEAPSSLSLKEKFYQFS
jgi:hypothetical protein